MTNRRTQGFLLGLSGIWPGLGYILIAATAGLGFFTWPVNSWLWSAAGIYPAIDFVLERMSDGKTTSLASGTRLFCTLVLIAQFPMSISIYNNTIFAVYICLLAILSFGYAIMYKFFPGRNLNIRFAIGGWVVFIPFYAFALIPLINVGWDIRPARVHLVEPNGVLVEKNKRFGASYFALVPNRLTGIDERVWVSIQQYDLITLKHHPAAIIEHPGLIGLPWRELKAVG